MREIKFRAWDKLKDKMLLTQINHYAPYKWATLGVEVMQYTGSKDKNGVEIYEGDIIEFVRPLWGYDPDAPTQIFRKALNQSNLLELLRQADAIKDGEVIGNIYENPDLLSQATTIGGKE